MDELRKLAVVTVAKGTGFGLLAIACVMVGFSYTPSLSLQAGGVMTLLMSVILLVKAWGAAKANHRRTAMWSLMPEELRPPEAHARWVVATVLRDAYTTFAMRTAALAAGLFGSALGLRVAGFN